METIEDTRPILPAAAMILAGHSHLSAITENHLQDPPRLRALESRGDLRANLHVLEGVWPRDDAYWRTLADNAANADIVLVWGGNEHNVGYFFQAAFAFDFLSDKVKKLMTSFQLVSQGKIKRRFAEISLDQLDEVLAELQRRSPRSVTLVGTPPPKRDNDALRRLLEKEPYFCDWAAQLGQSIAEIRITEPHIRLKLWYLLQEMIADIGRRRGPRFIPVPAELQDEDGFLLERYSFPDVTHANAAYGEIVLRRVLAEIGA